MTTFLQYMRRPYFGTSWKAVWFGRLLFWGLVAWTIFVGNYWATVVVVMTPLMIKYMWWLENEKDVPVSETGRLKWRAKHSGVCPTCGQRTHG